MTAILNIQNLKCGGCAKTIKDKLTEITDIKNIEINIDQNMISFIYEIEATLSESKKLLYEIGYPIVGYKNNISTKAKSFLSCAVGRIKN